ncbi:50S ribosomal protein L34e [Candidatus Woesearchaeota archaeon]|nr:50S ribosomal protein L34e [Candidatus Woesearchaeota archaeon]
MAEPYKRSRTLRRVKVKLASRTTVHYKQRKPKLGTCGVTGQTLKGVPRELPNEIKKLSKTERRPERPYGGVLSSKAMRSVFKEKARKE